MLDLRPVFYVVGLMICCLGMMMLLPALFDWVRQDSDYGSWLIGFAVTEVLGLGMVLTCRASRQPGLSLQQAFLMTVLTWIILPLVAALPLTISRIEVSYIDAFFESMSGLTTTGSTVFVGLDAMPKGVLLWRALLQWLGGVGIIVMAVAILPELKVGGMQLFRSESFDTMGKILPKATEIARSISGIYIGLTALCLFTYVALGVAPFDALCHAMTTIATGGFANYDTSFAKAPVLVEYAAVLFMLFASLPFIRYVQFMRGEMRPLFRDPQIILFLSIAAALVITLAAMRSAQMGWDEKHFRQALFNGVSILSGTGYASADYWLWGGFAATLLFLVGLIGGCAGSTCCAIKIFRFQVLYAVAESEVKRIFSPRRVSEPRYDGKQIETAVITSVSAFFLLFSASIAVLAVALALLGEDFVTAVSGAATAVANVGPGLGEKIGPSGNFADLSAASKILLSFGMLLGRLELFSVLVLFLPSFWRG